MSSFTDGYNFIQKNLGVYAASLGGIEVADYVGSVEAEIQKLTDDINQFQGTAKSIDFLKGDVAEFWHADTYNIDAAVNKSALRMEVPRSTNLGSVDVQPVQSSDNIYSLKYYKDGEASAKAQAQSVLEGSKGRQGSSTDPLYAGQYRLIPADQIADAETFLKRKIAEESVKRPDQVPRYQEALDMLRDRVSDSSGNESVPLTEQESRMIANLAKTGEATDDLPGLEAFKEEMLKQSVADICKAGLTAATISLVLKTAPEVFAAIDQLIANGELDEGQFKAVGTAALSGGSEGFVRGTISASVMACLKHAEIDVSPALIGALTVIAFDTMKNAYLVSVGKKKRQELANELVKEIFVSTCALVSGGLTQGLTPNLPVLGYMLGSFVGSSIGSLTYDFGYKKAISFCVDTGFTMFGLVEQDYTLPEDIIKEIGIDVLDYESFEFESFEHDTFTASTFEPESFKPESLDIVYLRRGVIGVSKIGYVV